MTTPSAVNKSFCHRVLRLARNVGSFFATKYAPLSGRHSLRVFTKNSDLSFCADSGVSLEYIRNLQTEYELLTSDVHRDCLDNPEQLSEFGRLVHFDYPKLLERMACCLAANVM